VTHLRVEWNIGARRKVQMLHVLLPLNLKVPHHLEFEAKRKRTMERGVTHLRVYGAQV
jgi:hypothetical protein